MRDEDRFIERAIRNVAAFCDHIFVLDHMSRDATPSILSRLAGEIEHVEFRRSPNAADAHRMLEGLAGTETWVLGVDGDELYDPGALAQFRAQLEAGEHSDVFRLKGHVLNCDDLDEDRGIASGYLAPPSRPVTKLFNMAAVESWTGCNERLQGGEPVFRAGFGAEAMRYLSDDHDWGSDPLRMLHTCFLSRSSGDVNGAPRKALAETGAYRLGWRSTLERMRWRRTLDPRIRGYNRAGTSWKEEWYALGERVSCDARPFLQSQ